MRPRGRLESGRMVGQDFAERPALKPRLAVAPRHMAASDQPLLSQRVQPMSESGGGDRVPTRSVRKYTVTAELELPSRLWRTSSHVDLAAGRLRKAAGAALSGTNARSGRTVQQQGEHPGRGQEQHPDEGRDHAVRRGRARPELRAHPARALPWVRSSGRKLGRPERAPWASSRLDGKEDRNPALTRTGSSGALTVYFCTNLVGTLRWAGSPASTRPAPTASCAFGAPGPRPEPRSPSRTAATSTAAAAGNRYGPSIAATNPTRRRGCLRSAGAPGRKPPPGRHAASTSGDCRSGLGIRAVLAFGRRRRRVNVVGGMGRWASCQSEFSM